MKTKLIAFYIIAFAVIAVNIISYFNFRNESKKFAYVDLQKVFNEFQLKAELSAKYQNVVEQRQLTLDSLALNLESFRNVLNENQTDIFLKQKYNLIAQKYQQKSQEFENSNQELQQKYNDQIWAQINQYVKEYSSAENLMIVFGGNGSGSIMYVDESKDITTNLINYINAKYNGN